MLPTYEKILKGNAKPKFIKNKSLLSKAVAHAQKILQNCEFCDRKCGINRYQRKRGFCRVGKEWRIFGAHTHHGEEPELCPSATLFLSGCTMRCCYCQNAPASVVPNMGEKWPDNKVVKWIEERAKEKCKNVNFVTPDCYIWNILKVLSMVKSEIPIVWNSSSYYSEKTALLIKDFIDLYLLDFRYFSNDCAQKLSQAPYYVEATKRNFLIAQKNAELLVRILVLPNHIQCCAVPALKWIKENLGSNTRINIMNQYAPTWQAVNYSEIYERVTEREYGYVKNFAEEIGLTNLV